MAKELKLIPDEPLSNKRKMLLLKIEESTLQDGAFSVGIQKENLSDEEIYIILSNVTDHYRNLVEKKIKDDKHN